VLSYIGQSASRSSQSAEKLYISSSNIDMGTVTSLGLIVIGIISILWFLKIRKLSKIGNRRDNYTNTSFGMDLWIFSK
jgi:hypothetical protein